jgi:hypothetical protein
MFPVGSWAWHTEAGEPVRIIEVKNLWGHNRNGGQPGPP